MNKTIKRTGTAGVLVLALTASLTHPADTSAASIKINKKKLTLSAGKSFRLKIKGSSGKSTWKSSSKRVASVSKKGLVKAKKAGKAKITATLKIRKKIKKFSCKVTVKNPVNTSKPAATNNPAVTNKPNTPSKPTVTNRPVSSNRPDATGKPAATGTPATTDKPSATHRPAVLPKPTATTAPPASTVTEQSAYATLNSLRSTYPEGMPLTNSYYYYSPRFGNGYGCYGFAAKLSDTVFGTEKPYTVHSSFDKIKVGDNIRIGNSHSVIVLTKENGFITVVEGNYNSSVHWDRRITSSSLASSGFKVYTRY